MGEQPSRTDESLDHNRPQQVTAAGRGAEVAERVLFVSAISDPEPIQGNNTSVAVAREMIARGVPVEIVTVARDPTWRGPVPDSGSETVAGVPHTFVRRGGIDYHVVAPPAKWYERTMPADEWNEAVAWASAFLQYVRPSIVHQWQWQDMPYFLEAALRNHIPTVYSPYDFGIGCLRTLLVRGTGELCNGTVGVRKCSECIVSGRGLLGRANELVVRSSVVAGLLRFARYRNETNLLARHDAVMNRVEDRIGSTFDRCRAIFSRIDAVTVTSAFAGAFFRQFGLPPHKTYSMSWFHDYTPSELATVLRSSAQDGAMRLAFVGRISPEKGIHILLEALSRVRSTRPIVLTIAGGTRSAYADDLRRRFPHQAGRHRVVWLDWLGRRDLLQVYRDADAVVIPSICYETGPRTLIEALALGRPVICTDLPPMNDFVKDGVNGLVFPCASISGLVERIETVANSPDLLDFMRQNIGPAATVEQAVDIAIGIYRGIERKAGDNDRT